MSENDAGPGTTTVLPPAPPSAPPATGVGAPPPQPPRRRVPVWVIVAIALAAAAIGGTAVYLKMSADARAQSERFAELAALQPRTGEAATSSPAAAATATPRTTRPATRSVVPTAPAKPVPVPKPVTIKQLAIVKQVTWSSSKGYRVVADYVQMLTGQAAADAASAAGQESPPPNGYFMLNESPKLRTLAIAPQAPVIVLGWGGTDATAPTRIPLGQFMDVMPGGTNPQAQWTDGYYWLTLKNGTTVTRIQQLYLP